MTRQKVFKTPGIYKGPWEVVLSHLLFQIAGLVLIFIGFQLYSLVCIRNEKNPSSNTCEFSHSNLFQTSSIQFPLSQLKEARIEQIRNSKNKGGPMVVLVTDVEVLNFSFYVSNFENQRQQEIVSSINSFLQNPNQEKLSVKNYPSPLVAAFVLVWNVVIWYSFFSKLKNSKVAS